MALSLSTKPSVQQLLYFPVPRLQGKMGVPLPFTCSAPGCSVVGQEGGVSFSAAECFTKHLPNAPQVSYKAQKACMMFGRGGAARFATLHVC
jgi:hypothetical protein